MKRLASAVLASSVIALVGAVPAHAQYVYAGGGVNIPVSDFKTTSKTGWIASAGIGKDVGSKGLWVEAEGWYGSNKAKATTGVKTDLWSALGAIGYDLMSGKKTTPYILGGAGVLGVKHGKTTFGYSGAVGLGYKASESVHLFVEGRWLAGTGANKGAKMIPVTAGLSLNFGKKTM